jgi:hypothetical protein
MTGSIPVNAPRGVGHLRGDAPFPAAAERALGDEQLRRNLLHATSTIRAKRSRAVAELDDWQQLRAAGAILTGYSAELAPWLASHRDVNAMDLTGAGPEARDALREAAADTVKRVYAPPAAVSGTGEADWTADPGTARLSAFTETKTVWHPLGI